MKTFMFVLLTALGAMFVAIADLKQELAEAAAAYSQLQQERAECDNAVAMQNAEIARYGELLDVKTRLLQQSATRQVELVMRQPQVSAADASELNEWLTQTFGAKGGDDGGH